MSGRPDSTGVAWFLRKNFDDCVFPMREDIVLCIGEDRIKTDRATARLLAKRINQCLDATVKK